jgi:hypothetical protein
MGALTEAEIFDCLLDNCEHAASHSEDLARNTRRGPVYLSFREELRLVEGACRQASAWREDARWLNIANDIAEARKRAGEWLRGVKIGNGPRRAVPEGQRHPLFMKLAENLRALAKQALDLRDRATGKRGAILPVIQAESGVRHRPQRVQLPPGMVTTPGGIIIPHGASLH